MTMIAKYIDGKSARIEALTAGSITDLLNIAAAMQEEGEMISAFSMDSDYHYEKIGNEKWTRYSLV